MMHAAEAKVEVLLQLAKQLLLDYNNPGFGCGVPEECQ